MIVKRWEAATRNNPKLSQHNILMNNNNVNDDYLLLLPLKGLNSSFGLTLECF
jgi:hypothetical protein